MGDDGIQDQGRSTALLRRCFALGDATGRAGRSQTERLHGSGAPEDPPEDPPEILSGARQVCIICAASAALRSSPQKIRKTSEKSWNYKDFFGDDPENI